MPGAAFLYQAGNHTPQFDLPIQFFLTADGANTAPYNHNGNYAAAPVDFYYKATQRYDVVSFLICISDNATFNANDYGGIAAGTIVNGVRVWLEQVGKARRYLLSGYRAVHNYDWMSMTKNVQLTTFAGTSQTLTIDFMIVEGYGCPLTLLPGDKFGVELNDDFSGLVSHTFGLRGRAYI